MIDSFNEYQRLAGNTDIISPEAKMAYYPLGLNGEAAEVVEKIDNAFKDNTIDQKLFDSLALELGDVAWYVARMSASLGYQLDDVLFIDRVQEYQLGLDRQDETIASKRLSIFSRRISIHAGAVADKVKKVIRDNGSNMDDDRKESIRKSLASVMAYVTLLSAQIGYPMCHILQMNIDKLASRQERGKLGGSGDNR